MTENRQVFNNVNAIEFRSLAQIVKLRQGVVFMQPCAG
jgi:hypothetical protein